MNDTKKFLSILTGSFMIVIGIASSIFFALVNNLPVANKIIAVVVSLAVIYCGWWLLKRGSKSTREALTWFVGFVIPW